MQRGQQRRHVGGNDHQHQEVAEGKNGVVMPIGRNHDDQGEADQAHDRGERQIADVVAEAVADDDPEIDAEQWRPRLTSQRHHRRGTGQVDQDAKAAPRLRGSDIAQCGEEQHDRRKQEHPPYPAHGAHHRHGCGAGPGGEHVDHYDAAENDADDRLLALDGVAALVLPRQAQRGREMQP